MKAAPMEPAALAQPTPQGLALSGHWTARGIGTGEREIAAMHLAAGSETIADGARIEALDTAGAWVLQTLLARLRAEGTGVTLQGLRPEFARLLAVVAEHVGAPASQPAPAAGQPAPAAGKLAPALAHVPAALERVGRSAAGALDQALAMVAFVGETAVAFAGCVARPSRLRWRPVLFNLRTAGFDALPIVGLLSFLLGVVVAYQGADQLRQYGANIFVADLVGLSMLREFAPLITAIIIAGRSGSAYAAQIGTMAVTEEIDAMRTIGIAPMELLVLPKIIALTIAMPLLTVFADVLGVFGGMLMAQQQLGITHVEFLERFTKAVSVTSYAIGIGKAPVFAAIIALVGCHQGFRTKGGAESVGRQTTRAVVQSIFLVIVADALFSVAFSALDL